MADDVGSTYGPDPCAVLSAGADEIRLEGNRGNFQIRKGRIMGICRGGMYPWFFRSVRIRHKEPGLPTNLEFKPMDGDTRSIFAQLRELGYPSR